MEQQRWVFEDASDTRIDGVQLSRITLYSKELRALPLLGVRSPGAVDLNRFQRASQLVASSSASRQRCGARQ